MKKRIFILGILSIVFIISLAILFILRGKTEPQIETVAPIVQTKEISDSTHTYHIGDIKSDCEADDMIFCAVERTVKCTLAPELEGCNKDVVPAFILGKTDENTPRPTEISFTITKIKPIPESHDISVYTKSDCDATWFGLCKGTVIYSLTNKSNQWVVTNIYALE